MADSANASKKTAQKSRARRTTKKKAKSAEVNPVAVLAADFDRSQLKDKTRVHAIAKDLGLTSKDVIVALDGIGLTKVAQSSLSRDEASKLLDALSAPARAAAEDESVPTPDAEPVEKIRRRVEKNVENEIHQIEQKVERDLAEAVEEEPVEDPDEEAEKIRHRVEKNVENEIHQIEQKVERDLAEALEENSGEDTVDAVSDFIAAAEAEKDAELLEDVISEVTPPPAEAPAIAPIFRAPEPAVPAKESREDDESHEDLSPAARRRRGRRGTGRGKGGDTRASKSEEAPTPEPETEQVTEPVAVKGSTRLEAQRRRRAEMREEGRKNSRTVSMKEFLERRESVERIMVVRERARHDHPGGVTQVGVVEDGKLVEQFVTSETQNSMVGNIYFGRVQNVLPSMEAAFIDIGKGRNGVLYAGEVNWKAAGLGGRNRRIEQALKSGDQILVQVTKDPVGHKGARLTTQISLAGRYLVYVPGGRSAGISRKLPGPERKRLKDILGRVVPNQGGAIIRTAAEGVSEEGIAADVGRLHGLWEQIQERAEKEKKSKGSKPVTMYEEPDMLVKVVRDIFNEDFTSLVVDGDRAWNTVDAYVRSVAPDLMDRLERFDRSEHDGNDAFEALGLDEQLTEALDRKVMLPSGGSLIIDHTEAMTVIDVNTGRYTGKGGNLEETVTRNNIEAAEEIVRQLRLRDIGGMIVVDFIDMVLPVNQDLVLRRLNEALESDRTRHQVSEVTSLGLVQMTRKRLGAGLLETFTTECEHCAGRGLVIHEDPVEHLDDKVVAKAEERSRRHKSSDPAKHPMVVAMQKTEEQDAEDLEELAASVIVDDAESASTSTEAEVDSTTDKASDEDKSSRKRSRRRGGRGRGRRVDVESIEQIAAAAVDSADAEDPEEPSGADYVADTADAAASDDSSTERTKPASYEEAVKEFESSPRRRRATRGNSRSDVAPRREDFVAHTAPAVVADEADEFEDASQDRGSRSRRRNRPSEVHSGAPKSAPSPRSRRRAVRRTMRDDVPEVEAQETREAQPEPSSQVVTQAPEPESTGSPRRRRRRVVRKGSGGSDAPGTSDVPARKERKSTDGEASSAPKSPGGRRRRAARRSR